ncbi:trichohyalin-like [Mytilus trossulus]|uniref:trichohyalin-like n=1 Tax=Mytilus trossulus TaxID=6551 RepID=UPI003005C44E
METDNNSINWNIRSLMVSLFQVAFSEMEANIMFGSQVVNCNETEIPLSKREEIITDHDKCAAFYKSVRDAEYNKLVDAYAREKIIQDEKERNRTVKEEEKIISTKDIKDGDECAAFYKSVRDSEYDKLVEAYARENIIKEEKERNRIVRVRKEEKIISTKDITDVDECAAFYKSVRDAEYNRLVDAYAREKIIQEERERKRIVREEEKIISTKDTADGDECAAFYKSVRDAEYNKLVDAYAREKIIQEERERKGIVREEKQRISTKEITDDDECAAFYKSVRDAEYDKVVEAFAREKKVKEEKERKRITREQEKIKTQFEEFWKPATDLDSLRRFPQEPKNSREKACTSPQGLLFNEEQTEKRQTGPFLSPAKEERIHSFLREQHTNYQSFQMTDTWNVAIEKELDGSEVSEIVPNKMGYLQRIANKVFKRSKPSTKDIIDKQLALKEELKLDLSTLDDNIEDEDIPDTSRTTDSEWFSISLSDTEETPRPHLKPFFSSVLEEIHVSTITSNTKESAIDIEVDFQSKPNNGFTSFRQWFCQLCCCHRKPDEDFDN